MNGKLIVFEGVEGCGKSTQIGYLKDWLGAHPGFQRLQAAGIVAGLVTTREPGGTGLGRSLRQILLDAKSPTLEPSAELLLYAADRAQHVGEVILPALAAGSWVLCDRFVDSTVAYQGYGRGLDLALIDQLNGIATQGIASDLTLWLQLEAKVGLIRSQRRGNLDRMEQADAAFHQRVQQGFEALAVNAPDRIVAVDAAPGIPQVTQSIQAIIEDRLNEWYAPHLQTS